MQDKTYTNQQSLTSPPPQPQLTPTILTHNKFQHIQKLTQIMQKYQKTPPTPQYILQNIKTTIKNSYNTLYQNYQINKNIINRNILQTQNEQQGGNRQKMQSVLKDKNTYDKIKVQVDRKLLKLKKLSQIKQQLIKDKGNGQQIQTMADRMEMVKTFEQYRNILQYQTAVFENMKKQRDLIRLFMKQKYENMLEDQCTKNEKIKRLHNTVHTKKIILEQIQYKIKKQNLCQIPLSLSEELERKLEEYAGKYTQQEIIAHEKIIREKILRNNQIQYEKVIDEQYAEKREKENVEKQEFQIAYQRCLLKAVEEEKIKKFCRVETIGQITNGVIGKQKQNLQTMASDIEKKVGQIDGEITIIRTDIATIMTTIESNRRYEGTNVIDLQKELENEEAQLRRLKAHTEKKHRTMVECESILQGLFGSKCTRENMVSLLKQNLSKYEGFAIKHEIERGTAPQTKEIKQSQHQKKFKKVQRAESSQISASQQL